MNISFEIPIEPKSQKRDRITSFGGHARSYKDKAQSQYEGKVAALIAQYRPDKPLEGALSLFIDCLLPIPVSKSKKWKYQAMNGFIHPIGKPDLDNCAKNILDIMSGVFFRDDKQVVILQVSKSYSTEARWKITLGTIEGE
jgi:Holliday junction resolvase RusA-like endonuclease